jgi:hypothetical protein
VFFQAVKKSVIFDPILGRNFVCFFHLASQVKNTSAGKKKNSRFFSGWTHNKFERSGAECEI